MFLIRNWFNFLLEVLKNVILLKIIILEWNNISYNFFKSLNILFNVKI